LILIEQENLSCIFTKKLDENKKKLKLEKLVELIAQSLCLLVKKIHLVIATLKRLKVKFL
jgi:hypothetical protein